MANTNAVLNKAGIAKKDEFYTQLTDIEKEMRYYREYFKGKTVLCNCDDPYESNFFKYFAMNFNALGLKKLIATCYVTSPIIYTQLSLFGEPENVGQEITNAKPYKVEITEVTDENGDGRVDLSDVEYLLKNKKNVLTLLDGDGDFRSQECIELLKSADTVATNPPFSLFREYLAQLFEYKKDFIIIGNQNAITYKEVFPLIKANRIWLDNPFVRGAGYFRSSMEVDKSLSYYNSHDYREGFIRVPGVRWFTNLEHGRRHQPLQLMSTADNIKYSRHKEVKGIGYKKYDNYDAIEVPFTDAIPGDYDGIMGVPISFLDKYCPEQFEIVQFRKGEDDKDLSIGGSCPYFRILIRHKKGETK